MLSLSLLTPDYQCNCMPPYLECRAINLPSSSSVIIRITTTCHTVTQWSSQQNSAQCKIGLDNRERGNFPLC